MVELLFLLSRGRLQVLYFEHRVPLLYSGVGHIIMLVSLDNGGLGRGVLFCRYLETVADPGRIIVGCGFWAIILLYLYGVGPRCYFILRCGVLDDDIIIPVRVGLVLPKDSCWLL